MVGGMAGLVSTLIKRSRIGRFDHSGRSVALYSSGMVGTFMGPCPVRIDIVAEFTEFTQKIRSANLDILDDLVLQSHRVDDDPLLAPAAIFATNWDCGRIDLASNPS
ncbi:hypothetical protein FH972_000848 [Carpinus fangiana]|uniref:Uncharacterized protein n=1 Tax=Carpinus fangiana TaxID=176857 RepID=A0A5N6QD06_9ROSI|nr:hypothetical protein FH972_000848 [Carpinus fangiana]